MKNCYKCGQVLADDVNFCSSCGEATENGQERQRAREQKCLDRLSTGLKHEGLAFRISGIVYIALAVFFLLYGGIMAALGGFVLADNASYDYSDDYYDSYYYYDGEYYSDDFTYSDSTDGEDFLGGFFLSFGLSYGISLFISFLAVGIVDLVLAGKAKKYRAKVYSDCTDAVNHAGSVGTIVLGAFFSSVALVFIIINFVNTKNDKETFEKIKATQQSYNASLNQ